jgi:glutamyl-Q tRNA(Asp) synthetase
LVAALASYLEARAHGGQWLLRMEDVDSPRVVAGAADDILRTLEAFGFLWDGDVLYQSMRGEAYRAALEELSRLGLVYCCACSRRTLADGAVRGVDGPVYPGTCRTAGHDKGAQRFVVPQRRIVFGDTIQGRVACDLAAECGDFVLRRADGIYTYQLAVVVDDAEQGITDIVRGADLLASTPRQIVLQEALGLPSVRYAHLPVALDEHGDKLSKQTLAQAVAASRPLPALLAAATFLGIKPPAGLADADEFWAWAVPAWPGHRLRPVRGHRPSPCNS